MKMKNVWMFLAVLMGALTWTSCSEDDPAPVVGITAISVTPEGSAVSYNATITGTTAVVEVDGETTDEALANATVSAVATLGSAVYFNDEPVGAGVTADFTGAVTLVAKGADGKSVAYTVNVERVFGSVGMTIKSSRFNGFPANVIDYDMTFFKGKFYAIVSSTTEEVKVEGEGEEAVEVNVTVEHYDLFSSVDGVNWVKVEYNVSTEGVTLPEGQDGYVVGGEGARLVVHDGRLFVMGGSRLNGEDIYGNPSEMVDGWTGPGPSIAAWRSFSTADGVNFKCDTVGISVTKDGVDYAASAAWVMPVAHASAVSFNGKIFVQGGLNASYGMWQMGRRYFTTTNGTDYQIETVVGVEEGVTPDVNMRAQNAFFEFQGKLWCLGGYKNFLSTSQMANTIWSSEDGLAWKQEAEYPVDAEGNQFEAMMGLYDMAVVATDEVVYIFGGATNTADGNVVSNKIFKSTDCVTWEEVADVPAAFTGRRHSIAIVNAGEAWLFGGISDATNDTYGYPLKQPFTPVTETWVKTLD